MLKFKASSENKTDIEYTKGDTFKFEILSDNGLFVGDIVRFQISEAETSKKTIMEKTFSVTEENKALIEALEGEFAFLTEGGKYFYRLTVFGIDDVVTTVLSGSLIVKWGA